ncbi:MAG: c-type cytochrome [Cyanobacteria bacterium]|nr:c-type cytochrome [Cyanobacteriota bacterium]
MLQTTIRRLQTSLKRWVLLTIAVGTFMALWGASPAIAADLDKGQQIFSANCAACHAGGNNVVVREKNLKKETLEKFGMDNLEAIKTQLKNGKGVMPSFSSKLSLEDMENAAAYVLAQAEKGW